MLKNTLSPFRWALFTFFGLFFFLTQSHACDVPVFRYALERWPVDYYIALVVEDSPLSGEEKAALAKLSKVGFHGTGELNLAVEKVSREELNKTPYADSVPVAKKGEKNSLNLIYPVSTRNTKPLWTGPITAESVGKIIGTPYRKKLSEIIIKGASGVFVLLESGNKLKDKKVKDLLINEIKRLNKSYELPESVVDADSEETPSDLSNKLMSRIPFKIEFSLLTLSRTGGDEVLTSSLLGLGENLHELRDEPMVFAVYGRGRSFEPMIKDEISVETLEQISAFFCGKCSCQVKDQNPGTDLLLLIDWDKEIFGDDY